MMKRIAIILLLSIFIVGCGSPAVEESEEKDAPNEQEEKVSESEDEGTIKVDKGLLNVEITMPASLFMGDDFAETEAEMKEERNADVTQNDDGSITLKMSKKEHKKLLEEMKEELIESITEIVEDDELASIKDITYNKDFSEFKMIVEKEAYDNSFDGFAILSLGFVSLFYQAYNGKDLEKEKVSVLLVDKATSEVFEEVIFPEAFDAFDGLEDLVED